MSDSFGELFRITSFGESHGPCIGVVVDGCPAGLKLNEEDIQKEVDKRKPATGAGQTARTEEDRVEILSGVFEGRTTGAPICLQVSNKNIRSEDYTKMRMTPRPGHADYTAYVKYGGFNDYRGGGRFSGRTTAGMVMAGAVARKLLETAGIKVLAFTAQIGGVKAAEVTAEDIVKNVYSNPLRCADLKAAKKMTLLIERALIEGDSLGGVIEGWAVNVPAGLGEPYFDTLEGQLAKGLFSIPAVKGVEFGSGFSAAEKKGSQNNDTFVMAGKRVITTTNNAGGILGGISDGMPLIVRVAIKPTPSISMKQPTVDLAKMKNTDLEIKGRHDVCLVPRAVIVVESMLAITLCDFALQAGILPRILKRAQARKSN
jgi:chorismate synthase